MIDFCIREVITLGSLRGLHIIRLRLLKRSVLYKEATKRVSFQATTEKRDLVFELSKTHVDQQFKDEMTNILISKGNIKPSFSFMEKINVHITKLRYT